MSAGGDPPAKPARKTGFSHLLAAAAYSGAGLRRLLKESAFRQEVALGLLALIALVLIGVAPTRIVGFVVLFLALVAVEALNTAIEVLVDQLSPEWAEFARDAKDLGSLAVGALLVGNAIYLIWAVLA
jgi:diacylglycerol kinase (ATP)